MPNPFYFKPLGQASDKILKTSFLKTGKAFESSAAKELIGEKFNNFNIYDVVKSKNSDIHYILATDPKGIGYSWEADPDAVRVLVSAVWNRRKRDQFALLTDDMERLNQFKSSIDMRNRMGWEGPGKEKAKDTAEYMVKTGFMDPAWMPDQTTIHWRGSTFSVPDLYAQVMDELRDNSASPEVREALKDFKILKTQSIKPSTALKRTPEMTPRPIEYQITGTGEVKEQAHIGRPQKLDKKETISKTGKKEKIKRVAVVDQNGNTEYIDMPESEVASFVSEKTKQDILTFVL